MTSLARFRFDKQKINKYFHLESVGQVFFFFSIFILFSRVFLCWSFFIFFFHNIHHPDVDFRFFFFFTLYALLHSRYACFPPDFRQLKKNWFFIHFCGFYFFFSFSQFHVDFFLLLCFSLFFLNICQLNMVKIIIDRVNSFLCLFFVLNLYFLLFFLGFCWRCDGFYKSFVSFFSLPSFIYEFLFFIFAVTGCCSM